MIHKSIMFAANAHRGQLRKGTNLPYIIHPMEVAQILSSVGASQDVVVAGILHDTLEDTSVTLDELVCYFGKYIAWLVSECSNLHAGSWRTRKSYTVTKLAMTADSYVALILCADKLSNLRSIVYDTEIAGQKIWTRFSAPQEDVIWYYEQLGKALSARTDIPTILLHEYTTLYALLEKIT